MMEGMFKKVTEIWIFCSSEIEIVISVDKVLQIFLWCIWEKHLNPFSCYKYILLDSVGWGGGALSLSL